MQIGAFMWCHPYGLKGNRREKKNYTTWSVHLDLILSQKISLTMFDQVMVNLGLLFNIVCKAKYSNETYRLNNLMLQTK